MVKKGPMLLVAKIDALGRLPPRVNDAVLELELELDRSGRWAPWEESVGLVVPFLLDCGALLCAGFDAIGFGVEPSHCPYASS